MLDWLFFLFGFSSAFVRIEPSLYEFIFLIIFIYYIWKKRINLVSSDNKFLLIVIGMFLVSHLLSIIFSPLNLGRSIFYTSATIYLCLSTLLFSNLKINEIKLFIYGYLVSAVLSSVLSILGLIHIPFFSLFTFYNIRAMGYFKDPNVFGPFLIPILLYSIEKVNEKKQIWLIFIFIISLGLWLSFSRGAWLNFIITIFIWAILFPKKFISKYSIKSFISITMALLITIYGWNSYFFTRLGFQSYDNKRFETHKVALEKAIETLPNKKSRFQPYDNERFETHKVTLERSKEEIIKILKKFYIFLERISILLFGYGPGLSEIILGYATHNAYLRLLFENGLLGFIFWLIILEKSLFYAYSNFRLGHTKMGWIIASLIGILVNSFFIDTIHWRHLWFLLGLALNKFETREI